MQTGCASNSRLPGRDPVDLTCSLVGAKEEQVIFHRSTERKTKLVLFERRTGLSSLFQEEIVRVEDVSSKKLKKGTVIVLAALLRDYADVGTCCTAERSVVEAGLYFELFDRVGIRDRDSTAGRTRTEYVTYTDSIE